MIFIFIFLIIYLFFSDIANAAGPLASTIYSYSERIVPSNEKKISIPIWVLVFSAVCLVFGLSLLGDRVMKVIGKKITKLSPIKSFIVQFFTAFITLSFSIFGLPLSTTHCVVGCVFGLDFAVQKMNIFKIKWGMILKIVLCWVITIPFSGVFSLITFWILKFIFL